MERLRALELSPARIAVFAFGFGLAAYAAWRLVPPNPLGVAAWFGGAVIGHDLILLPAYTLMDLGIIAALRRRGAVRWVAHVRVPLLLSGVLLLIFLPLIVDRTEHLIRWLLITGLLHLVSAVVAAVRLLRERAAASSEPA